MVDKEELLKQSIEAAAKASREKAQAAEDDYDDAEDDAKTEENVQSEEPENAASDEQTEAEEPAEGTETEECETSEETEEDASEEQGEEKKRKSFFSKKDKKDKRDEQIAELNDKLIRNLAEFQNFRTRTEKEKAQMFEMGARSVVEKILETIDNFERGLATVPEDKKEDSFVQGMDKIYKQLLSTLEGIGVKPIDAVGQPFDPNLHNAVMHVDDENFGENTVCEEFQKGYMYRDSVVRHSMVKVAN